MSQILRIQSCASDPMQAVDEIQQAFKGHAASLILFFCSHTYDLDQFTQAINTAFPNTPVCGCTSGGEIGPEGYKDHSVTAILFPKDDFSVATACLSDIDDLDEERAKTFIQSLILSCGTSAVSMPFRYSFALQIIDGLSNKEEIITHYAQKYLGRTQLIGASASDALKFHDTQVFYNGEFRSKASLLILFRTNRPFRLFKTQHFYSSGAPMVVTSADLTNRTIHEIDGLPAGQVYADMIGIDFHDLSPDVFAAQPFITRINGNEYVRSIQQIDPVTKAIKLFCAIDEGVLLRIAKHHSMIENLETQFSRLTHSLCDLELVLMFDCIMRKQEMIKNEQTPVVSALLKKNMCSGFSSFGEQFGSLHINQTCTGIAFGREG